MPIIKTAVLFALVIGLTGLWSFSAGAATVREIRFTPDPSGRMLDVVLTIDSHLGYRAFTLSSPDRVVIDLPNIQWSASTQLTDPSGLVTRYRHGAYQNGMRVVLDVSQPVRLAKTQTIAKTRGQPLQYLFRLQPSKSVNFNMYGNSPAPAEKAVTTPLPVVETVTTNRTDTIEQKDESLVFKGKKLIVIDAGHGGVDPGAIATNGVYEKNITLAVARELKNALEDTGHYRVKMTRDSDVFVILQNRVKIARRAKGDLFVSLHADTISRPAVQGASVYTLSDKASDAEAARLAERENQVDALVGGVNLGVQDKDVADILLDLVVRDNMNQSKILADTVVMSLRRGGIRTLEGSHRFAGFAVLKAPDIPSILIEMGYLSNANEAERLSTAEHRQKIARAVMRAIDTYFNETSKKTEF